MSRKVIKFKKLQKVVVKDNGFDYKRISLLYGIYGLKAIEPFRLKEIQLEAARKTIKKVIKKLGDVWVLLKANRGVTQKPQQVRMGKGKGSISYSVALVQKGTILFELGGRRLTKKLAFFALKLAAEKLPFKTEICIYKT